MKSLLRSIVLNSFALALLPLFVEGVQVIGGLPTLILGGVALTLMLILIKPVISILSFPLNLISFGAFSIVSNAFILYLLTTLVSQISVSAFQFRGISLLGFVVPRVHFNLFFAYLLSSCVLFGCITFFQWLTKR